ncbi:hypothetical protein [Pandoravirus japonicus]|uniref:Uncharacterized protein n=1 Tax=Pandoravirus japonicus TaxID=2823154 RepID=A0A811BR75_9VIRU|nr:hypothetical protein [Pandoravirus japonicus]
MATHTKSARRTPLSGAARLFFTLLFYFRLVWSVRFSVHFQIRSPLVVDRGARSGRGSACSAQASTRPRCFGVTKKKREIAAWRPRRICARRYFLFFFFLFSRVLCLNKDPMRFAVGLLSGRVRARHGHSRQKKADLAWWGKSTHQKKDDRCHQNKVVPWKKRAAYSGGHAHFSFFFSFRVLRNQDTNVRSPVKNIGK